MITIKNFESSRNMPDTFGYISIGSLEDTEEDINKNSWCLMDIKSFKATCEIDGKEFKLIIPKVGIYALYVILGDLTQIPIELVVDNSEIKQLILEKIHEYMDKTFKTTQYYSPYHMDTISRIDNSAKNVSYLPGSVFNNYSTLNNKQSKTQIDSTVEWTKYYNEFSNYATKLQSSISSFQTYRK